MKKVICDHCKKEFKYNYVEKDVCFISIAIPEYDADSKSFRSNSSRRVSGDLCEECLKELYNKIKCFVDAQEEAE